MKDGFVIRKPEKACPITLNTRCSADQRSRLTPRRALQIHSRYRAAKALEAKRKGRHSGTGALPLKAVHRDTQLRR